MLKSFVKRSLDGEKKLLLILLIISASSGALAFSLQYFFGESTVYRDEFYIDLEPGVNPIVNINTAGMPVEIVYWSGDDIKVQCVAELPLIVDVTAEESLYGTINSQIITISQDDGFAISIFTPDMFRYNLKVFLPESVEFEEINVHSTVRS
jgi:hypothetical protein